MFAGHGMPCPYECKDKAQDEKCVVVATADSPGGEDG
jgi:hypothetical protein